MASIPSCLLAAALLLTPAGVSYSGDAPAAEELLGDQRIVVETLREVRSQEYDSGQIPEELTERFVATTGRDSTVFTFLLEILADRRIPALGEEPVQALSIVQEELLLEAFARGPQTAALRARDRYLSQLQDDLRLSETEEELDPGGRDAVIKATGAIGLGSDVELLFELAPITPRALGPFEVALARLLANDPVAHENLRDSWMNAGDERLPACIHAAGAGGDRRALIFLEDVMRWDSEARVSVATSVQALGRAYNDDVNNSLGWYFEDLLSMEGSRARQAAAQALATLRHEPAIPALIEALEAEAQSPNSAARESIVWALRTITGLQFSDSPAQWRTWLKEEQRWLTEEAPLEYRRLEDPNPAVVADALRTLSQRRFGRDEIAGECTKVLSHKDSELVKLTCSVLINLGSLRAVGGLYWALREGSPDVAEQAWLALKAITKLDLPMDPEAWRKTIPIEVILGA